MGATGGSPPLLWTRVADTLVASHQCHPTRGVAVTMGIRMVSSVDSQASALECDDLTIPSFDGLPLRAWSWRRATPRGVIVIAHGFGEHGGCYRHVAEVLGPALDVDVLAFDFR